MALRAQSGREFAAFGAAVVVFIVNEHGNILTLSSPKRSGRWEVVNGAVDAGETVLAAALREVREEAGPELVVRPICVVHTESFDYDVAVRNMISVMFVMAAEGGTVSPGDDMEGSAIAWQSLEELTARESASLIPPLDQPWIRTRAVELWRQFKDDSVLLQRPLDGPITNKYTQIQAPANPGRAAALQAILDNQYPECHEIVPGLLLGTQGIVGVGVPDVAPETTLANMRSRGIVAVVNCTGDDAVFLEHGIAYFNCNLPHKPERNGVDGWADLSEVVPLAVAFIQQHTEAGETVFVHCNNGQNRSAAVVTAFLMASRRWSAEQAYLHVCSRRSIVETKLFPFLKQYELSLGV